MGLACMHGLPVTEAAKQARMSADGLSAARKCTWRALVQPVA